ncbi:hypothetical protein [Catenulispora rubra]|uniref:hypothetical protein n=1 Tax=Catenulispora rubra TaxID=280293 RepID=UPI00189231AB|nr:hypothetical protein [Catenulispora rubra]
MGIVPWSKITNTNGDDEGLEVNRISRRSAACFAAVCAAAAATALIGPAAPAVASDGNCNGSNCLWLDGSGLHIDQMSGSSLLINGFYGHFHFWVKDWSYNTSDQPWPQEAVAKVTPPDQQWPDQTLACVQGWQKMNDGSYKSLGDPACVTLHT